MKTIISPVHLLGMFALAGTLFATACKKDKSGTFTGETVNYQGNQLSTYLKTDEDGAPVEIGFTIPEATFNSFDALTGDVEWSLNFPTENNQTPFVHLYAGYNPHGHEPLGIYDKPHFDLHYYTTDEAARQAILPTDTIAGNKPLPEGEMPPLYINTGVAPGMGSHWVDVTAPELNGQPFTETFIFGTFDGVMTFYEPMITKAFIESKHDYERTIPAAAAFAQRGKYYPTKSGFRHNHTTGEYQFYLNAFVKR